LPHHAFPEILYFHQYNTEFLIYQEDNPEILFLFLAIQFFVGYNALIAKQKQHEVLCVKYEIGQRIKECRESRNMSQKDLAAKIGISSGRLSNWEQGLNRPNADIIARICKALDVSPSEILGVCVTSDELSAQEKRVIRAYREKAELQHAVNVLLGLEES